MDLVFGTMKKMAFRDLKSMKSASDFVLQDGKMERHLCLLSNRSLRDRNSEKYIKEQRDTT